MRRAAYSTCALMIWVVSCGPHTHAPAPRPGHTNATPAAAATDGRLPPNVKPLAYRLSLNIDPEKPTFSGRVDIETDWALPSAQLVLNGVGLTVHSATIDDGGQEVVATVSARSSSGSETNDELVLTAPEPLPAGKHVIRLAYQAAYPTDLAGLYRTKEDGRWYVFSQFESIDARRAFPCFDEPGYKTPFSIRVEVPSGIKAFSNTSIKSDTIVQERHRVQFEDTKPLPTYLVAFAIGDLDVLEPPRAPGETATPVRFIAAKGKGAMGKRALTETRRLVGAFERYLGVPFPYPKLDMVAVPDFAAGGMENAGLILCRAEVMALAPDAPRSIERHQSHLLAHEIAHQWFGDLVTAKWWDDIWLNEAFASWAQAAVLGEIEPAIGNRLDTIANAKGVIAQDSLPSARPIRSLVRVASAASETFDGFTYDKGAAILEMVRGWIGDHAFRKGLATYFEKHAHKNATSSDLFAALEDSSHKPVAQVVRPYVDEPGSPLLVASRDAAGIVVRHWNEPQGSRLPGHPAHPLPLCVSVGGAAAPASASEARCALVEPGKPWRVPVPPGMWAYPNASESSYGQVIPDRTLASELVKNVDILPSAEQMGLVDSAVAGFELGLLPFATVDALFRRLSYGSVGRRTRADSHLEARAIVLKADALLRILTAARGAKHPALSEIEQWVRASALPHHEALGWTPRDGEEAPVQAARSAILHLLAEVGDPATLQAGLDHASRWLKGEKVDRDVLPTAFAIAARSPKAPLDAMWQRAMTTPDPQIRVALLQASTSTADPEALTRALDRALTDDVKASELRYILAGAFDNHRAHATVYAWVKSHWDALHARASWLLARRLGGLFRTTCTREEVADARAFFTPRAKAPNARRINLGLEAAERCVALGEKALASAEVLQVLRGSR